MKKILALLCVVTPLFGIASSARAADAFFLVFIGNNAIAGESVVDGHAGEIDVISFSMGVSNPAANRSTSVGGAGAGKAQFQDILVTKPLDKASPRLMVGCARGERYGTVVLKAIRSVGMTNVEYCTVTLSDVMISNVRHAGGMVSDGANGSTGAVSEVVALSYGRIQIAYRVIDASGKVTANVQSGFDVIQNKTL